MATLKLGSTDAITESSGALTYVQAGGLKSMQVFETAGTFTGASGWQRPPGVTTIKVYVTGGGGGASSSANSNKQSGAGGGTAIKIIDVTSITAIDFTVGAGGGGAQYNNNGNTGTTSSFGGHCTGTGGIGATWWGAASGGVGTDGDLNIHGQGSEMSGDYGNFTCAGGSSFWGGGGKGSENSNSTAYNGGGAAAVDQGVDVTGGTGLIVVEEYS